MNQLTWTLTDDFGKPYVLGIGHSAESGNLVIYCNQKVVQIDFKVKDSKMYSFLIGEELIEVEIIKTGPEQFEYSCQINKEANTPRNLARRKRDRKHRNQSLLFVGGLLVLILVAVTAVFATYGPDENGRMFNRHLTQPIETVARVVPLPEQGMLAYEFAVDGQSRRFTKPIDFPEGTDDRLLINGLPLRSGDLFKITYADNDPRQHVLDLGQPAEAQVDAYIQRVTSVHDEANTNLNTAQAECQVKLAYRIGGLAALAMFYHQTRSDTRTAYLRFIRDLPFRNRVGNCR